MSYKKFKKNPKKLQQYASKLIPGVSQLFGKRPDLYLPGGAWPTYYSKAKGVTVWGIDKKKYYDFTMVGIGTSVLGYSDKDIIRAGYNSLKSSTMNTLNPPEDVELAEILMKIHPWAQNVRYCRTGGESMSIAIRLARAYNKREKILFSGYHGWHDWYLSANIKNKNALNNHLLSGLEPIGVPKSLKGLMIPFNFNDYNDLKNIVEKNAKDCAAIVIEPCRDKVVEKKFLSKLRKLATKFNTVLIFDEITSGWRTRLGGVHLDIGVNPDLVVYGKTIANGVPMGVILGKKKIMKNSTKTFLSSSFWTEKMGPACALAFIKKSKKISLNKKLINKGKKIKSIWEKAPLKANLKINISEVDTIASFKLIVNDWPGTITYFIQEMLKKRFLASDRCYANYCHSEELLKKYEKACVEIFRKISLYNELNIIRKKLDGPVKRINY